MKTSRIILIGIIIVIAITSLVLGLNYLKGNNFFVEENNYFVKYNNISGLSVSNPVLINGFRVGQVKDIQLLLESDKQILVELNINNDIILNDSSVAMIYSLDLMGSKGVNLSIGNGITVLSTCDTLKSDIEEDLKQQVSAQMLPLKLKAEDLMSSIEDAMKVVKNLFNKTNTENIEGTLKNLNKTFKTLEHTSSELDQLLTQSSDTLQNIFANVENITANLSNNSEQINYILNNIALVSDSLAKSELLSTINNANKTLAQTDLIMRKITNGEGTIGQLINNDTLYYNLENASENLDRLLIDLKENPKRYIHYSLFDFGKTIVVDEQGLKKENSRKAKRRAKKEAKKKEKDLSYFIQIKSANQPIPENSKELKNVENITEHYIDGRYKYTIGNSASFKAMKDFREGILDLFPDAFITQYDNDSITQVSN